MERCKNYAKELNLEGNAIFYGALENPYPYMKNCDIYIQPSKHEGYCITLAEAKLFNRPIITTNFVGAKEQLIGYNNPTEIVDFPSKYILDGIIKIIE